MATENNIIIDGKAIAAEVRSALKKHIASVCVRPVLAVILVGENEASRIYVRNKEKAAAEVGIECRVLQFGENVSEKELFEVVQALNEDPAVNGIIIQQPLPEQLDTRCLVEAICPEKDVDGFGPMNLGRLQGGSPDAVVAATPKGVLRLIDSTGVELSGKHAVIIGRSNIVGKPLSSLLLNRDCTVTVTHSKTVGLKEIVCQADIVVAACGCPRLVKDDWVKDGAVVIDVGINRTENGKLCGDVDFDALCRKNVRITPVPGGVGPMTVAMLLENTWQAFQKQKKNI